jgi:hypothetical protein
MARVGLIGTVWTVSNLGDMLAEVKRFRVATYFFSLFS